MIQISRMPAFILCASVALLSGIEASAQSCDMSWITQHHDENKTQTPIYSSESGLPALFFTVDMDVNTDGAARSYHPNDPRGERLALNNMGNAISKILMTKETTSRASLAKTLVSRASFRRSRLRGMRITPLPELPASRRTR